MTLCHDGEWVVSGSLDGTVRVWDVHTGREMARAITLKGEVYARALSPDGQWLLLRHVSRHMATLVHLPSGASESFALPGEAVVVGWR